MHAPRCTPARLITSHKLQGTSHRLQVKSCQPQAKGYGMQVTRYRLLVTSYKLPGRKVHPGAAEPFDPGYDGRERRSQAGGGPARIKPPSFLHYHGCLKVTSQPWSSLGIGGRSAEPCPGCPPAWSHSAVRSTCTSPCHTLGGHCDRTRRLGGNASIGYSDRNSAVTDGVHIPRTVG